MNDSWIALIVLKAALMSVHLTITPMNKVWFGNFSGALVSWPTIVVVLSSLFALKGLVVAVSSIDLSNLFDQVVSKFFGLHQFSQFYLVKEHVDVVGHLEGSHYNQLPQVFTRGKASEHFAQDR